MRDPLRNVSVRYKLAFAFLGVCFLAFGIGGYLVSRSARASLEREILAFLGLRSQFYATILEGELGALGRRARDFASDGFIRTRFEELDDEAVQLALRAHLLENKLPLEPAFLNIALTDTAGERTFLAVPAESMADSKWTEELPAAATGVEDWFSGLLAAEDDDAPLAVVISTPLWNLAGDRRIGTLLIRANAGVWIAGALRAGQRGTDRIGPEFAMRLSDGAGATLDVPFAWVEDPPPVSSQTVQSSLELRVRLHDPAERSGPRASGPGVLSQSVPIELNGWSLETTLRTQDALAAVSGLQSTFLLVGLVLTAAASLLLVFPMRFLAGPLLRLRDAATHIREGDFSVRVPVESTDEVGELSNSFNLMAEAVEERAEKLEAAAQSLQERKNELRKERDRLNAIILSMRDGLIVLDADGQPEVWNAAAEPLRAIVQNGGLQLSSHRNCQRAGTNGQPGVGPEATDRHPCLSCLFEPAAPPRSCLLDIGPLVYEIHSSRLAAEPDGRSGRVLVARDVTDRVHQDEREIHQERLSVLGEVAAVMAHELNNPLAAIHMFAQMLASKLAEDSPLREDVTVIQRNTETCTRTIRELLDYATGATPEVGPVDVHANLREVASFLRAVRERKEVEFELILDAEDPIVVGDEVQLRQVFVNLVLNAFQAVGKGHVRVRTQLDGGHLAVDVMDDGPGIPAEATDAIFRPFYTTKPRGRGTGLGLSTARRITEIQGGGLELIDGRPGHTTFRVRLLRGEA